jgi:hypothetical protein
MFSALLSNVQLGTANFLAYTMLGLVIFFLVFGPAAAYYFWKRNKKMGAGAPTPTPPA